MKMSFYGVRYRIFKIMDYLFIKLWMFRKIHNFVIFFLTHESGKRRNWGNYRDNRY